MASPTNNIEVLEERIRVLTASYAEMKRELQSLKKLILQIDSRSKKTETALTRLK